MTRKLVAASAALAITAAACSGGDDTVDSVVETTVAETTTTTSTTTTTTTEPPETTTTVVDEDDSIRQPLTGEVVASEDDLEMRAALVVKIDNNDRNARDNQSGLAVADIVFEEIVEGDTRFAAVFHTQGSEPVGPIRSGREQDVEMLSSLNEPLFAWSGGNGGVTRLIADSFLTDLNVQRGGEGYFRGPGRNPHDLYNTTERLWEQTPEDHPGPPARQFSYVRPDEEFTGEPVAAVDLSLEGKRVRWEWDADVEAFARLQSGSRHVDVVNGDIFATNVIVMVVDYPPSSIDARSPDAQTIGSGPVYVFSNGQVVAGRWERSLAVGPIRLVDADGEMIPLTPGNTWIELAENKGGEAFTAPAPDPATVGIDSIPTTTIEYPQIALDAPELAPTDILIAFEDDGSSEEEDDGSSEEADDGSSEEADDG
jgi:hypothetical protein